MAKAKKAKKGAASVVDTSRYDYDKIKVRDKSGKVRHSANNGDAVAKALLVHLAGGGTIDQVIKANKLEVKTKGKNAGLVRMSVGVALRGLINNGTAAKIGKLDVKTLKQPVSVPKVEALAPRKGGSKKKAAKKKAAPRKRAARKAAAPAEPVADATVQ